MEKGVRVLSYDVIKNLSVEKKVKKIVDICRLGEIVMIEGSITPEVEYEITKYALKKIDSKFSGVEIGFLKSSQTDSFIEKIRSKILNLIAKNRFGVTVIGPSKIIKDIKMDPNKLEIFLK